MCMLRVEGRKSFNDAVRLSWLDRPTRLEILMEVVLMR